MKIVLSVIKGPHQGKDFEFSEHDTFVVGRGSYANFRLPKKDPYFSRAHFIIEVNPPLCRLMDLSSSNGTYVNGQRTSEVDLKDGDRIRGGDTEFLIRLVRQPTPQPDPGHAKVSKAKPPESPHRQTMQQQPPPESPHRQTMQQQPSPEPPHRQTMQQQPPPEPPHRQTMQQQAAPAPPELPAVPLESGSVKKAKVVPAKDESAGSATQKKFGEYATIKKIGQGGMGAVYVAHRESDQRKVAIKTISQAHSASPKAVKQFLRETSIIRQLVHRNIVRFLDSGSQGKTVYFVMEFVDGEDASSLVRRQGPLSTRMAVGLTTHLLSALEFAHEKGFVHRDIKPANLMVYKSTDGMRAKLTDFGLARIFQASQLSGLTLHGEMGGSFGFMAPEQISNYRNTAPAADLYAAAATLYYMLTGRLIYQFPEKLSQKVLMVLQQDFVPITEYRKDLSPALVACIQRGLNRKPKERFASAREFRKSLVACLA